MAERRRLDEESRQSHPLLELPDELLVLIVSHLPLNEAAATSLLSHQRRYLWSFAPRLDLDGTKLLRNSRLTLDKRRSSYIRRVNRVIALRKDSTTTPVEYLRVHFNLSKSDERHIDRWIGFALDWNVHTLELDLTSHGSGIRGYDECYSFPHKFLTAERGDCFKNLKKLLLNYVNVNDKAVEFFLRSCPLLEDVAITRSGELSSLKITDSSLRLKCLEICWCTNLNSVEIHDSNLVCFTYRGGRIRFSVENVPLFVGLTVEEMLSNVVKDVIPLFSSFLPQLQTLKIYAYRLSRWETRSFYSTVKLSNLKQLIVNVTGPTSDSFPTLTNLISASPCLQRFVLEASDECDDSPTTWDYDMIVRSYACLKEVRFVGYRGAIGDVELVMHFVDSAAALEKIVMDPRRFCEQGASVRDDRPRAEEQLREKVPQRIHLEILS